MRTNYRISLGKHGEELACGALRRGGYAIVAQRYRTRRGEIDIVARDGLTLVFVEVKARADASCGTASEAITRRKRHQLARMAADYLARHRLSDVSVRFDVVTIDGAGGQAQQIEIVRNAFDLSDP